MFMLVTTDNSSKVLLRLFTLIAFHILVFVNTSASTFKANLNVCFQTTGGVPVENATVIMKGGNKDLTLKPGKDSGCYTNNGITFDDSRKYSLQVVAEGYVSTTEPLDISAGAPNGILNPNPIILTASVRSPSLSSSPPSASPSLSTGISQAAGSDWMNIALIALLVDIVLILLGGLGLVFQSRKKKQTQRTVPADVQPAFAIRDTIVSLTDTLKEVLGPLKDIETHQKNQMRFLSEIVERLPARQVVPQAPVETINTTPMSDSSCGEQEPAIIPLSNKEKSRVSYERFLRDETVSPDPIYLSDVGGSSMKDMVSGRRISLEENPQGAIILFQNTDGDGSGWIYPNTTVYYRREALKVFSNLTADQFECLKSEKSLDGCNVEPVLVRRVPHTRQWQVETVREEE